MYSSVSPRLYLAGGKHGMWTDISATLKSQERTGCSWELWLSVIMQSRRFVTDNIRDWLEGVQQANGVFQEVNSTLPH